MIAACVALVLASTPASAPPPDVATPVAVMPFKDLSSDPELRWLSVGIAETMTVDIQRGSHLQVVERDQLDHALAELALQGQKGVDASNAAKVGKMVGARTVVLGSYQVENKELRIVARFVNVETGVVQEAAKVTGQVENVFELQDAIVVKLVGTPFQDAVKRKKQKPKKTLAAYGLYAQSLTVMSDAERADLLQRALKEDPDFTYAEEDLLDLQDRLQRFADAHHAAVNGQLEAQRAKMKNAKLPANERLTVAMQLIGNELANRRLHAVLADTQWIVASDLPEDDQFHVRQFALFQRINAYQQLKEQALAMQTAQNFLEQFPGSVYFPGVQVELSGWMTLRAHELDDIRTLPARLELEQRHLADKLARREEDRARAERAHRPPREVRPFEMLGEQVDLCDLMERGSDHAGAARCYGEALAHRIDSPDLAERYRGLRSMQLRAEVAAGHFDAARREAAAFQKDDPEGALKYAVSSWMLMLPED